MRNIEPASPSQPHDQHQNRGSWPKAGIADILHSIERCQRYVDALDSGDPDLVGMAEDAIERNLQIIGEAGNHLPYQTKTRN